MCRNAQRTRAKRGTLMLFNFASETAAAPPVCSGGKICMSGRCEGLRRCTTAAETAKPIRPTRAVIPVRCVAPASRARPTLVKTVGATSRALRRLRAAEASVSTRRRTPTTVVFAITSATPVSTARSGCAYVRRGNTTAIRVVASATANLLPAGQMDVRHARALRITITRSRAMDSRASRRAS
jgi:hypothetical protein